MSHEMIRGVVFGAMAAILVGAIVAYVVSLIRDARLGEALRVIEGDREAAWHRVSRLQCERDYQRGVGRSGASLRVVR